MSLLGSFVLFAQFGQGAPRFGGATAPSQSVMDDPGASLAVTFILFDLLTWVPVLLSVNTIVSWFAGPTMVLSRFPELNWDAPNDENPGFEMEGRRGGLLWFLMSLIGLAPRIKIEVTPGEARLTRSSSLGELIHIVSLQAKPSVNVSVARSSTYLFLTAYIAVRGLVISILSVRWSWSMAAMLAFYSLVLTAGFALVFYFTQRFSVRVIGYSRLCFCIRPSLLSGGVLRFGRLVAAIDLMRRFIDRVEVRTRMRDRPEVGECVTAGVVGFGDGPFDSEAEVDRILDERATEPSEREMEWEAEADAGRELRDLLARGRPSGGIMPRQFVEVLQGFAASHRDTAAADEAMFELKAMEDLCDVRERI
jgi:hypothetical protein